MMKRPNLTILEDPRDEACIEIENRVLTTDHAAALMFADPETQTWLMSLDSDQLDRYRRVFRQAGMAGVACFCQNDGWAQLTVRPTCDAPGVIYMVFQELLQDAKSKVAVTNQTFVHDGENICLRIQTETASGEALFGLMSDTAQAWREAGLISGYRRDVYEPETLLFGGAEATPYVQQLVSCETAFWLAHHCSKPKPAATTQVALVLLRHIFGGLDLIGWEDIDIWNKLRATTGRVIPGGPGLGYDIQSEVSDVTISWKEPIWALSRLEPAMYEAVEDAGFELARCASAWRANCFDAGTSSMGLRSAAALYALHLFNRAGLSVRQQKIIAETLATRRIFD